MILRLDGNMGVWLECGRKGRIGVLEIGVVACGEQTSWESGARLE